MVPFVSFLCIVIFSILLSSILKGQSKASHLSSCLTMLVAMTKSTLIGIIVATWFPNMVFSTIIAILLSFLLVMIVTYRLSLKVVIECVSALFMGAMMGAMLKIMASTNELLCILFFTIFYILSVIVTVGFMYLGKNVSFIKSIPLKVNVTSVIIIVLLSISTIYDLSSSKTNEIEPNKDSHQHHHH